MIYNGNEEKITESDRKIHTPSGFARKNLIYAQETGHLKSLKEHSCIREKLESYLIFLVIDGKGSVITGGKEYKAEKGDVVFLDCRIHYEHKSDAVNPWEIRWVHFYGAFLEEIFKLFKEGNEESPVFSPSEFCVYEKCLDELANALDSDESASEVVQSNILNNLVTACVEEASRGKKLSAFSEDNLKDSDAFSKLRESVNEHIDEKHLERLLAIQYGIQPEELNSMFERKYGITLKDYILNRKLNKAKELLRFTIKPVEEIVSESGIGDEQTLRSLFEKTENESPEEYRKHWAQWIKS